MEMTVEQKKAMALAAARARADQSYSGSILPFSKDEQGNVSFDSNAGLLGMAKRAFMAPGDAYTGQLQVMDQAGNVTPEAIARGWEFANTFSPVNPGVASGDRAIPGVLRATRDVVPEAPTYDALKAATDAGYTQMRGMGVDYSSPSVKALADALRTRLDEQGLTPRVAKKTSAVLNDLSNPPEGSVASLSGLESARREFNEIGQNFLKPSDKKASRIAREGLDQFIMSPPEGSVVAGPAVAAAQVLREARGNAAAYKRDATITKLIEDKIGAAKSANSGLNIGNSLRQGARDILKSDKASSGFNADELAMLKEVRDGTPTANATRFVGNLLGGGGGLGAALTGAAGVGTALSASGGNPLAVMAGALAPVVGVATKVGSNAITRRGLEAISEATRMRSPLYEQALASAGQEVVSPAQRALLVRALLASQAGRNTGGGGGF